MMVAAGNFLFRYRNALFPFACLLMLLPGRALFDDKPLVAAAVGALVAGAGQFIRAVTIGLRYIVRGGRSGRVYADDLVTEGVYALCRNPMYVGNVLIVIGVAIASNSLSTLAFAVPMVLFVYSAIVAAEEQFLAGKFGPSFRAYCDSVPRWLPRLADLRSQPAADSFHWRRLIVKEYGTPFGWVNAICLVAIYNLWRNGTLPTQLPALQALVSLMVLATMLWATALILKRKRLVVAD